MNLTRLCLKNYRRFPEFETSFHPELTVIAARNGQGKTTILEAAAAALGPFVGAFDLGKSRHIERTDARYVRSKDSYENEQVFPVVIQAAMTEPDLQWERALNGPKSRTTTREAAPLAQFGMALQAELRYQSNISLPILRYYSSRRLWLSHKNLASKAILTESRTAGYEDCLSVNSSFIQLQEWMKKATLAVTQQRQQQAQEQLSLKAQITGIGNAVELIVREEGWSDFHYSFVFDELAMRHEDHGDLPISLLSDGVRAMISLAADLALRCARLNPHLQERAPQETCGIVLIDEVDLHLHPSWQQRVVQNLRDAFPKVQFIVTTHSPQLISTVEREHIRIVYQDADGDWLSVCPTEEVKGMESAVALNEVMGVSPIPPVQEAAWLHDYTALIEQGQHETDKGRGLRQKLEAFYGKSHPILLDADRLIRFQAFKLRNNASQQG